MHLVHVYYFMSISLESLRPKCELLFCVRWSYESAFFKRERALCKCQVSLHWFTFGACLIHQSSRSAAPRTPSPNLLLLCNGPPAANKRPKIGSAFCSFPSSLFVFFFPLWISTICCRIAVCIPAEMHLRASLIMLQLCIQKSISGLGNVNLHLQFFSTLSG